MKVSRTVTVIFISFSLLITVFGQQKDRTIEIYKWRNEPIKILSVKITGKEIKSKEKFVSDDDDWFSDLTVEVENTSNKKIANIRIALDFPDEPGLKGNPARDYIAYGTSNLSEPNLSQQPLNPGEKAVLKIENYESLRDFLNRVGYSKDLKEFRLFIDSVLFTDDTKWAYGQIFTRDPDNPSIWRPEKKQKTSIKYNFLNLELLKATDFKLLPFFKTETLNSERCYRIDYSGDYNCPTGCSNSYTVMDLNTSYPDYTQNTFRFGRRNTRCVNAQNQNCDNTVYSEQAYITFDCGLVGGGGDDCLTNSLSEKSSADEAANSIPEPCGNSCGGLCQQNGGFCDQGGNCVGGSPSPIVIDISGNGFDLTNAANGVLFDIDVDDIREQVSWTTANTDDAWLALDRNQNGTIDSGRELFGNYTPQPTPPQGEERNGFLALARYDKPAKGGNGDRQIDFRDAIFAQLKLWQDRNHNGISEQNELQNLSDSPIRVIELRYHESRRTDAHGNQFKYRAKVKDTQGAQVGRWAWDVFLVTAP